MRELAEILKENMLKAVNWFYVPVRNRIQSAEWWQRHFGLSLAVPLDPTGTHAILKLSDGQWLHLVETEGDISNQFPEKTGYERSRVTFDVRHIEKLYEQLRSSGIKVDELQDRASCGINFVFYDLDGNKFDVNEMIETYRTVEGVTNVRDELFAVRKN
jgi:hypothetical protein